MRSIVTGIVGLTLAVNLIGRWDHPDQAVGTLKKVPPPCYLANTMIHFIQNSNYNFERNRS